MHLFDKILIANRGEIAVRIIKSAKKLGIKTVAVYSVADENSLHVSLANEAYCIGNIDLQDSYLNIDKIIATAKKAEVEAIHPGYGFLSENAEFAKRCVEENIVFIGPDAQTIAQMGNKIEARQYAKSIDIPLTEGITGSHETLIKAAARMDFPILVKAAAGGGGKGMRIVRSIQDINEAIESTSREAKAYFGDESIFIEKYIENPRHIEFQIIGDNFGNVVHLFERECSIQRRYQKIVEESPSPTLTPELRDRMGKAAVKIGKEIGYKNAGTIEFLVDDKMNFYFLEINTRVQVEHPVTEIVTGIDIVEEQILIAANNKLRFTQEELSQTGHAIECRIYAEDPEKNFLPSPGKISFYQEPAGQNIRVDSGINKAAVVESFFDPMISKLIVFGENRDIAIKRSVEALKNYVIDGIKTNSSYLISLLQHKNFTNNNISTHFCENFTDEILENIETDKKTIPIHIPAFAFLVYNLNMGKINKPENVWESIGFWRERSEVIVTIDDIEQQIEITRLSGSNYFFRIDSTDYNITLNNLENNKIEIIINGYYSRAFISCTSPGNAIINIDGHKFNAIRNDILDETKVFISDEDASGTNEILSPMPGKIIKISSNEGDELKKGEVILVVESMKMENNIVAPFDLKVLKINVAQNDMVDSTIKLIDFEAINED